MPEIGTSSSMSGDGKRSVGHRPQATAPVLDLYEGAAVKGISVAFSDLDSLLVTDLGARSSPAAAKRCAKGAGLEGAPKSVTSSSRSQIFSYSVAPAFV